MIMISSTVDELGEGAWKDVWATRSEWLREWGRQAQSERAKHTRAEVDLNSRAVKPRHHLQTSQPLCTPATGQATDQHCFAFNVT